MMLKVKADEEMYAYPFKTTKKKDKPNYSIK